MVIKLPIVILIVLMSITKMMKHNQYYFINNFGEETKPEQNGNKITVSTNLNVENIMKFISIENDTIFDLYIFNFVIDNKLHREFDSDSRVEELCSEFDKVCTAKKINKNSIKLNIVYVSQFTNIPDNTMKNISNAKIDNVFKYVHPFYASILKIIFHQQTNIDNIAGLIYNEISEPLDENVCVKLVKLEKGENICGLYFTPRFEQLDKLTA